ncbi:hypothetical protein BIV24_02220 [Streptomyces colonosanans]|uniref:ABC transporter domain-containing protein n=1 Tax=Streptomyces colonosanans TaxID=1428652 RepID=A0A1S2Q369_9ACTN|nr:hypothetical protein BIV24_02220 [Streptomyces colonosanans]
MTLDKALPRDHAATVEFQGLRRKFGSTVALDGLDLAVRPGELLALLGPSGCGKTTALRMLAGFEHPDSGEVLVDGEDVTRVPAHRRDAGMVFQSVVTGALSPWPDVAGNDWPSDHAAVITTFAVLHED